MKETETIYVRAVPTPAKRALERIAFERTQAGDRTTLRDIVLEALAAYLNRQADANYKPAPEGSARRG